MTREAVDDLVTLPEAARRIGWKGQAHNRGRRLRRYVEARERALGRLILDRSAGRWPRVSMRELKRTCPKLFPSKADELAKDFGAYLRSIDEKVEAAVQLELEAINPQLDELRENDKALAVRLEQLATQSVSIQRRLGNLEATSGVSLAKTG